MPQGLLDTSKSVAAQVGTQCYSPLDYVLTAESRPSLTVHALDLSLFSRSP
jgi:hypothetical protein